MIYCITQHQINKQVKDWPFTQKAKTYVRHHHISTLTLLSNYVRKLCRSKFRCKSILINASQFLAKIMKILHFTVAYECHKITVPSSKVPIAICYTAFCVNKPTTMYCTAMCHGDAKIHAL